MKKFFSIITTILVCTFMFAQSAKSTGLTDSDVKSFCQNYNTINSELADAGVIITDTDSFVLEASAQAKVTKVLNKLGISGNNAYDKVAAITYGYNVAKYDEVAAADPKSAALLKSLGMDPMAEFRSKVADSDQKVINKNLAALTVVFENEIASEASDDSYADDYDDFSALMNAYAGLAGTSGYDDMTSPETRLKQDVLKKYDTKKKFKVIKTKYGEEWIIVEPSDITFANSDEAFIYAENYTGAAGTWCAASSFGYLGGTKKKDDKPLYVWLSGGVGLYKNFPVDFDGGAPDEFISDEDVTPAIAKQAVLQMYRMMSD